MKLVQSLVAAAVVAIPALSFAQPNDGLTRADVRAELRQVEQAGYRPVGEDARYPQDVQSAVARVRAGSSRDVAAIARFTIGS